jgi:hypothetical protein
MQHNRSRHKSRLLQIGAFIEGRRVKKGVHKNSGDQTTSQWWTEARTRFGFGQLDDRDRYTVFYGSL